jgi:hypothetical protein
MIRLTSEIGSCLIASTNRIELISSIWLVDKRIREGERTRVTYKQFSSFYYQQEIVDKSYKNYFRNNNARWQ